MAKKFLVGLVLAGLCASGCAQETTGALIFAKSPQLNNQRATSATLVDGTSVTAARVILGLEQVLVPSGVLAGTGVTVDRTTATVTINASSSGTVTTSQTVVVAGAGISVANDGDTTYTVTNTGVLTTPTLVAGSGISVTGTGYPWTVEATVVTTPTVSAGAGIAVASDGVNTTVTNTGLLTTPTLAQLGYTTPTLSAGPGISVAVDGSNTTVTNTAPAVAEADTLQTVTNRGNSTTQPIAITGGSVVADAVFAAGGIALNPRSVAIGNNSLSLADDGIAIGTLSEIGGSGFRGTAIGYNTVVNAANAVALGTVGVITKSDTFNAYGIESATTYTAISGPITESTFPVPNVTEIVGGTGVSVGVSGSTVTISATATPEADTLQTVTDRGNTTTQTINAAAVATTSTVTAGTFVYSGSGFQTTGGNARGTDATDLQANRSLATQVASGSGSAIGGGTANTASGQQSAVAGGTGNVASGTQSFIGGGASNVASAIYAAVLGGFSNDATASGATVVGGANSTASGASSIAGGNGATASGTGSIAFGTSMNEPSNTTFLTYGLRSSATATETSGPITEATIPVPNVNEIVAGSGVSIGVSGSTVTISATSSGTPTLQQVTTAGNTTTLTVNANRLATSTTLRLQQLSADPSGAVDGDGWFRSDTQRFQDQRGSSVLSRPGTLYSLDTVDSVSVGSGNTDVFPSIATIPAGLTTAGPRTFRISIGGYWTNGGIPSSPNVIGLRFSDPNAGISTDVGGNLVAATAGQGVVVSGTYLLRVNPNNTEVSIAANLATQEGVLASPWITIDGALNGNVASSGYTIQPYAINNDTLDSIDFNLTHFTVEVID